MVRALKILNVVFLLDLENFAFWFYTFFFLIQLKLRHEIQSSIYCL